MPHSELFCIYDSLNEPESSYVEQDKYINDENIDIIDDEYNRLTEREIYRDIFRTLQIYNDDLHTCFPTNVRVLDKSQQFPILHQNITPDGFVE